MSVCAFLFIGVMGFSLESVTYADCEAHVLFLISVITTRIICRTNESMLGCEVYEIVFTEFNSQSPLETQIETLITIISLKNLHIIFSIFLIFTTHTDSQIRTCIDYKFCVISNIKLIGSQNRNIQINRSSRCLPSTFFIFKTLRSDHHARLESPMFIKFIVSSNSHCKTCNSF